MIRLLEWRNGNLTDGDPETPGQLLVADSWIIREGQSRWPERHLQRWLAAATAYSHTENLLSFLDVATHTLSKLSDSWPRLELWYRRTDEPPSPALRLRPPPAAKDGPAKVWLWPSPDPRQAPRSKGPDLDLGRRLRAAAPAGCDEVLLCGPDGILREGVWSSLLHWRGDCLVAPPAEAAVLAGITRDGLLTAAAAEGVPVLRQDVRPDELANCETWLLSSVIGIRPVATWLRRSIPAGEAQRAPRWQALLQAAVRPVVRLPRDWSDRYT